MKRTMFALLLVSFATLGLGAPSARAQFLSMGDLQFGPSVGAGLGFTHNQDAKNFCPAFKNEVNQEEFEEFISCASAANAFKGYVSGTLDFTSQKHGYGVGLILSQEWNRSLVTKTSVNDDEDIENESVATGIRQFGIGANFYLPIPSTMQRLVLVPSIQQIFWTASTKYVETENGTQTFNAREVLNGKALQYGGSLRFRVANHIWLEGGVSYENLPATFSEVGSIPSSVNLWDYAFGVRYVFWGK